MEEYADLDLVAYLYNTCYGGFSFSDEFIERLNEKRKEKGLEPLHTHSDERTDPQVIETFQELGWRKSSGRCARLHIHWFPSEFIGYIITHEYDGVESVGINKDEMDKELLRKFLADYEKDKSLTVEDLKTRYDTLNTKYKRYTEFLQNVLYKKKQPSEYRQKSFEEDSD